jgi:hypothetical protein
LLPVLNAYRIQGATDDMISYAGEVLDPSAADKDNGVFLEIVADTRNIGGHLDTIGQSDASNFSKGGIGFLGGGCINSNANTPFLR